MNISPHTIKNLSQYLRLSMLTSAVVIFIVATMIALWVSYSAETRNYDNQTLQTTQKINEKVTLAIGMLHSMAAAHQASPTGFEQTQFEMFAENLVTNQSAITGAGRFDVVPHENLDHLRADMQLHGLFQFEPKTISAEGTITTLGSKSQYSTLVTFFPQDPVSANLIGLDFSTLGTSHRKILQSVVRNAPVPAVLPKHWFTSGQLNIFTPTYFGHYVPETIEDRRLQTDGGYLITLDLMEIISQVTGDNFPLSVGISSSTANNSSMLAEQSASIAQMRIITSLFPSRPIKHHLAIGSEPASIIYRSQSGVTESQWISALLTGLIALAVYLIALMILNAIRASHAQTHANRKALAKERERALVTLNSLQDAVITTDQEDNIDYINPSMLLVLKASRIELIGLPVEQVLKSYFKNVEQETIDHQSNSGNTKTGNMGNMGIASIHSLKQLVNTSSEAIVFDCHSSAIVDQDNNKIGAVLTMRNISKEHALTSELAHQATHDALTALPNRRKFETLLDKILQNKTSVKDGFHVVGYIDLDQFKLINDTVGHAAGDELLKKLAVDLRSLVPKNIEIARLGGDEFGFISTELQTNSATDVARVFHDFFQSYFYQTDDNMFSIRASIGLTTIKPNHTTINDVLSEVDIACYTAKDAGRNSYIIYDAENQETKQREGEMLYLPMLQTALQDDRFVLYTQAIANTDATQTQPIHHYECLLRLIDEEGAIVTPYKFIVAAERYDLINDIDLWVIESAFSQISKLKGTALEDTIFSINLSGQSAVDPAMPDFIDNMLTEHNIKSSNICFELTETAVISNFTQAQKLIAFVRSRGCTIALDDFGAGASSFGYLKNLEVDYLKIDGQFVKEMTSNKVDFEMVKSMNAVGKALGIKTIAEFVESEEIMQALAAIDVDYAQGYYIGKPSPMEDLLKSDQLRNAA